MLKLMLVVVVLAALAGAAAFVPLHGRTVLDRWNAARTPGEFLQRGWAEAKASYAGEAPQRRPARLVSRRTARPAPGPRTVVERHTEADRAALDRIVTEHAQAR